MEAAILFSFTKPSNFTLNKPSIATKTFLLHTPRPYLTPLRALDDQNTGSNGINDDANQIPPPTETVQIRFRRGSRRRRQQPDTSTNLHSSPPTPPPPKDWDSMTIGEKAIELYMGEKGILFWLNKFAYASIFIIIGGWILFRFVGPSLGLYQLDSVPLSPTSMFKSSSP